MVWLTLICALIFCMHEATYLPTLLVRSAHFSFSFSFFLICAERGENCLSSTMHRTISGLPWQNQAHGLLSLLIWTYVLFGQPQLVPLKFNSGDSMYYFFNPIRIIPSYFDGYLCQGILTNETRCLRCETVTARDETFLDLSLDIEQNSSITSCLKNFSSTETLNAEDKFFCDKCCR